MSSAGVEILGMILAVAGWLGVMVACGLPMWRVTAYIGQNIVISQVIWEGLWMNCSVQSTGQMHCKVHESMLGLAVDLQAARALVIVSMVLSIVGIGLSVAGAKCTNFQRHLCGPEILEKQEPHREEPVGVAQASGLDTYWKSSRGGKHVPLGRNSGERLSVPPEELEEVSGHLCSDCCPTTRSWMS
uniref:Claudin n=1 Tax=Oryzias melastigma TaxID=30732 RepID=A0A3B3DZ42_ORYME